MDQNSLATPHFREITFDELLQPMHERRAKYERNMALVREALEHGTKRGRTIARETMEMVRDALDLNYQQKD